MRVPEAYLETITRKSKLPVPKMDLFGQCILAIQDEPDEKIGSLYLPKNAAKQHRATVGTVVTVGDGWNPDTGLFWDERNEGDSAPLQVGDRILWGRWEDVVCSLEVEDEWWDSEEEKTRAQGKVEFIRLHIKDVIGVLK